MLCAMRLEKAGLHLTSHLIFRMEYRVAKNARFVLYLAARNWVYMTLNRKEF